MKNRTWSLYLFYALNFLAVGMTTFAPKFYGEIGLTDGQIGLIASVSAFVSLFAQPMWGMLADRMRYMRTALIIGLTGAGLTCFLVLPASIRFLPLLFVLTLYSTFYLPAMPVSNAIAIEHTGRHHQAFGPIRMTGTIGYQISILITGFLLARSLNPLYPLMGVILILAGMSARLMPPVQGEQKREAPVSMRLFFRDRAIVLLFVLAFLASIGQQFSLSFFSKFLG
ncbi:MAG: MFS transporter, partial [Clostridia bacterium]|nr:MFS transporter [Clostridia bacterium]